MTTYTPADFEAARFAEHPDGRRAMRDTRLAFHPWTVSERDRHVARTSQELAAEGWVPVREAAPLSLDTLREAWEAAARSTACRAGDVLIIRGDPDDYHVYVADTETHHLSAKVRILRRAPRREPWVDLADLLADESALMDEDAIEKAAKALYNRGVRVTGGGNTTPTGTDEDTAPRRRETTTAADAETLSYVVQTLGPLNTLAVTYAPDTDTTALVNEDERVIELSGDRVRLFADNGARQVEL